MLERVRKIVMGQKTHELRHMDVEIERVENASCELGPDELDRLRCEQAGVPYLPIDEAERLRKLRPAKKRRARRSLAEGLLDLVRKAADGERDEAFDDDDIEESEEAADMAREDADATARARADSLAAGVDPGTDEEATSEDLDDDDFDLDDDDDEAWEDEDAEQPAT